MPHQTTNVTLALANETLDAQAELAKEGLRVPGRPVVELPRVPARPTDLTDDQLMELFSAMVRWSDYIGGLLALQEVDERFAESAYDMVWAEVFSGLAPNKRSEGSVTVAKAETTGDSDVRDANERRNRVYAKRKVYRLMYDNLERDSALISRELTRRTSRNDREVRADRWSR